jgi:Kef-type K+ transport system membrane component KefB
MLAAPISPIAPHQLLVFLLQVALLLLLALCLGRLAQRLRMPAIVGELTAGVVVGPSLVGHLAPGFVSWLLPARPEQVHLLDAVGLLGVVLLVGITGSHIDLQMLRRRRATAARVSIAGLVVPLGLGVALGVALPATLMPDHTDRRVFALFIGVAMCVSAIPVIAKMLADMRLLHRDIGQLTLAASMVDDAVGWFLLSVVSAMATVGVSVGGVSLAVLSLFGFVLSAVTVGRALVRGAMRLAARSAEPGVTVVTAVIIILLGAAATQALGMEPIFGAFVAGILVGAPAAADQVKLAPLRTVVLGVLAPLFLATAGLRMDLVALAEPRVALAAAAVLAVAIAGKFIGAYIGAKLSRLSSWQGVALGASMNARGVIEVVVAMVGLRLGVLNTASYTMVVLVALVTSLMAPPLLRLAMNRVVQNGEERTRKATHDAWAGTAIAPAHPADVQPAGHVGTLVNEATLGHSAGSSYLSVGGLSRS